MKFEKNTELDQANLRLIVATCAILYVVLIGLLPGLKVETYLPIVAYYGLFLIASILLRQAIVRWPGHYPARRIFCMLHDYAGTSFGLIVGGEAALPLYAVMVWINLGNGMRYGSRYLAIATALALLALLVIYRLTPAWQAQPFMVLMLMTTSTVIPFYAHLLLERTRKATEEALQANQEKSRLLAQASHDLRQPIHSIGLFTACLRDARLGDEERRLVDNIDRSLLNVSQLFRSILDLYTLDNGRLQPKQENVHLGELLRDLVRRNAEAARWAGVELRLRPCRLWTRTDPGLLSTMLQNLLSNSLKYATERPLLIGVRRRGDGLAVAIYDQGRGIAEEHLPRVFEEFYRVRETRDRDVEVAAGERGEPALRDDELVVGDAQRRVQRGDRRQAPLVPHRREHAVVLGHLRPAPSQLDLHEEHRHARRPRRVGGGGHPLDQPRALERVGDPRLHVHDEQGGPVVRRGHGPPLPAGGRARACGPAIASAATATRLMDRLVVVWRILAPADPTFDRAGPLSPERGAIR